MLTDDEHEKRRAFMLTSQSSVLPTKPVPGDTAGFVLLAFMITKIVIVQSWQRLAEAGVGCRQDAETSGLCRAAPHALGNNALV